MILKHHLHYTNGYRDTLSPVNWSCTFKSLSFSTDPFLHSLFSRRVCTAAPRARVHPAGEFANQHPPTAAVADSLRALCTWWWCSPSILLSQCGSRQREEHGSGSSKASSCSQQQGRVCHHQAGRLGELGAQGECMSRTVKATVWKASVAPSQLPQSSNVKLC